MFDAVRPLAGLIWAAMLLPACTEVERAEIGGGLEGDSCGQVSDCEAGLDCADGTCTPLPNPSSVRGQCCDASLYLAHFPAGNCDQPVTCEPDLVCGTQGACTTFAGQSFGDTCGLSVDCVPPLVCHGNAAVCVDPSEPNDFDGDGVVDFNPDGTCPGNEIPNGTCPSTMAGARDLGESCNGITDCRRPYICAMGQAAPTCEKLPFFPGPNCIRSDDEQGAYRVFYELPPDPIPTDAPFEFYRLPFPNDIRFVKNNRIDLSGHPSPGDVLGIDVAGTIFSTVESDPDGFAINSPVYFRLSDPIAAESLCIDPGGTYPPAPLDAQGEPRTWCDPAGDATVFMVNIDPGSPGYQERIPLQVSFNPTRGQYACQNLLAVGPLDGQPLRHSTTYAAVITTGLLDELGHAPIPDLDFLHILDTEGIASGTSPLPEHVITATQPLRDWIADTPTIDASQIAAATVFTTGDPDAVATKLFEAVEALPAPKFQPGSFDCADPSAPGDTFACHAGAGRACPSTPNPKFAEIHGTYLAPAFQDGLRPYLTPKFGGFIDLEKPKKFSDEEMCFALTVPNTPMPPNGWPVIIYGHGTGANYRAFINKARAFSGDRSIVELFTDLGFAVLGFDNVMHGPRQGPIITDIDLATPLTWTDPDNLFFNVINAEAARDNVLQGAVDLFWLTRLLKAEGERELAERTLGVAGVKFDPEQIFYFGHSQGATIVFPFLTEDVPLRAAIISGAGAELALSILNKKEPINIAQAAGVAFGDQNLSRLHPMMGILAQMFGPSDAVSYVDDLLFGRPGATRPPIPLLIFSGLGDNYTPDATQDALFSAMNIPILEPSVTPYSNNVTSADGTQSVTAGVVRLEPDPSYDGHFVTFNHPDAELPLQSFLLSAQNDISTTEIQR